MEAGPLKREATPHPGLSHSLADTSSSLRPPSPHRMRRRESRRRGVVSGRSQRSASQRSWTEDGSQWLQARQKDAERCPFPTVLSTSMRPFALLQCFAVEHPDPESAFFVSEWLKRDRRINSSFIPHRCPRLSEHPAILCAVRTRISPIR